LFRQPQVVGVVLYTDEAEAYGATVGEQPEPIACVLWW